MLGRVNNATSLAVDGVFGPETEKAVAAFQTSFDVKFDYAGAMGPPTWEALTLRAAGLAAGSTGPAVVALQHALGFNGYPVRAPNDTTSFSPRGGSALFDAATVKALASFQTARGAATTTGEVVTQQTWHLLATGCNQTPSHFWFDAGWPQGKMSLETLQCLRANASMAFAIFECWVEVGQGQFWPECAGNIHRARAAGFGQANVGVYMFAQRYNNDTEAQVAQLLGNLTAHNITDFPVVMLDIEGGKWAEYTHAENRHFIKGLRSALEARGVSVAVYCGDEWPQFFGADFHDFSDLPLIYAHYDNVPSFYDYWPGYGGWKKPSGKQFWDGSQGEQVCGTGALDWDWSREKWW